MDEDARDRKSTVSDAPQSRKLRFIVLGDPGPSPREVQTTGPESSKPDLTKFDMPLQHTGLASVATAEPRHALLIGNGNYKNGRLSNPVNDVRDLEWALSGIGFSVTCLENASLAALRTAIVEFGEAVDTAGPQTVALIYYAGHGLLHEGGTYLLPVDAEIPSLRYLAARALTTDTIFDELTRTTRKANIVIIDACRVAGFQENDQQLDSPIEGMTRRRLPQPCQMIFSTTATMAAEDGETYNSPFAEALIAEIPGLLQPGRRIQDAFDDAAARVGVLTEGRQTPATYREGFLPPLMLSPEDETRLKNWSKRPRRWTARQMARTALASVAVLLSASAVWIWFSAYPETRLTWLLRAGLKDPGGYDLSCEPPFDGPKDRYGLTRRDWCLTLRPSNILARLPDEATWSTEIQPAFLAGDPKAVALTALREFQNLTRVASPDPSQLMRAKDIADRTARTDLPIGKLFPLISRSIAVNLKLEDINLDFSQVGADMGWAASRGVLLAKILRIEIETAPTDKTAQLEQIFNASEKDDVTGEIAAYASDVFGGRSSFSANLQDRVRDTFWLKKAAARSWLPAADKLLTMARDRNTDLTPDEADRLRSLVTAGTGPSANYWTAIAMLDGKAAFDENAFLMRMDSAANANFGKAIEELSNYFLNERNGDRRDPARGVAWLRKGVLQGSSASRIRLGLILVKGISDPDGKPIVERNIPEGLRLLEEADAEGDVYGTMALAETFRFAPGGWRDPSAAKSLYEKVAYRLQLPQLSIDARRSVEELNRDELLAQKGRDAEVSLGSSTAPVTMFIYFWPSCSRCQAFLRDRLPLLETRYVDTGKARLIIRVISAPYQDENMDAARIVQCEVPAQRLSVLLRLMQTRDEWLDTSDDDKRLTAFTSALEGTTGNGRSSSADAAKACLADPANLGILAERQKIAEQAMNYESIFPAFLNGYEISFERAFAVEDAIEAALPLELRSPLRRIRPLAPQK